MKGSRAEESENNGAKKWIYCDFCRSKKKPKFNPKHIEVNNTDGGQFQGPTCYLSVYNTETVPLSEEKKAALEAEKTKAKKKKKVLKAGLSPEEKEKELEDEHRELLKIAAAEDKQIRKIALEQLRKEDEEFMNHLKPFWYQELSYKQIMYVENLGEALRRDLLQSNIIRTPCILAGIGLHPLPAEKIIKKAACKCFMNPILFLLYLYKHFGKAQLKATEKYYCANDRLMLSAVTYLALPRTILELHARLPIFPTKPPTFYPAIKRKKRKTYTSPYLEPLPLLKHCYREEDKLEFQLRKQYLHKCKRQKASEEEENKIDLELITGGRITQPMTYSRKPDGHDQIKIMMENQKPSRKSLRPDKNYPIPSWKRKKISYCDKKKKQKHQPILPSTCGASTCGGNDASESADHIESLVSTDSPKMKDSPESSQFDNITANEIEIFEDQISHLQDDKDQKFKKKQQDSGLKKGLLEKKISEASDEMLSKKIQELISGKSESTNTEDTLETHILNTVDEDVLKVNGGDDDEKEDSYDDGLLFVGMNCFESTCQSPCSLLSEKNISQKRLYPKPIFLTLEDQFPRPNWGYKDYTIQPMFSTMICGYIPLAEALSEHKSVNKEDSEAFLYWKCMQLPDPIPTISTIKAITTGYWQQQLYSFRTPKLTPDDVKILKKGGYEIFRILAKNALDDMAVHGNPIASLPHVHYLPEIRQLIHARINLKLSQNFKDKLMQKSLGMWDRTISQPRREKLNHLEITHKKWSWDHISMLKKMIHKNTFEYQSRMRQALLDDMRDSWASMFMDYLNNPRFRNVFFSYLPSKENDILYSIP